MNGAEMLVAGAEACGIEICFANPGTTELPIVAALDSANGIRAVLGLAEGVCAGAADGYARMTGKPAMTLFHLGPGLANGIANLHNARRARSPVVNIVGDHASWHRPLDPPLNMDVEGLAASVSEWVHRCNDVQALAHDVVEAVTQAHKGMIATLIVPHEQQWVQCPSGYGGTYAEPGFRPVPDEAVAERAAEILRSNSRTAMVLGSRCLLEKGQRAAARIAQAFGCDLFCETLPGRIERGIGLPKIERIPYFPESALERLAPYEAVILAGAPDPVAFFGYPGIPGRLLPEAADVCPLGPDVIEHTATLEYLADYLFGNAGDEAAPTTDEQSQVLSVPDGRLTNHTIGAAIAALVPHNAVIVDESVTSGGGYFGLSGSAPRHSLLTLSGGSLGMGIPCATGAALACPDRPVINFQADGSGLYSLQALWTQAREGLNVTTVVCSNRKYEILRFELQRAGYALEGKAADSLTDLNGPTMEWTALAEGFGVPAVRVETGEELASAVETARNRPGPFLIEALL